MSTTVENNQSAPAADEPEAAPLDDWTLLREVIWPKRTTEISD